MVAQTRKSSMSAELILSAFSYSHRRNPPTAVKKRPTGGQPGQPRLHAFRLAGGSQDGGAGGIRTHSSSRPWFATMLDDSARASRGVQPHSNVTPTPDTCLTACTLTAGSMGVCSSGAHSLTACGRDRRVWRTASKRLNCRRKLAPAWSTDRVGSPQHPDR